MIQPPINLGEFSVNDLFAPAEPAFMSVVDEFEQFRVGGRFDQYLTSGEAEDSSRVIACPALVGYMMEEVARGRSRLVDSESAGRVSDTAVRALEEQVIAAGGRSVKGPEDALGHATTFMLLGSTKIQYEQEGVLMQYDDPDREGEQFGYIEAFTLSSPAEAAERVQDLVAIRLSQVENKALAEVPFRRPEPIKAGII